MSEWWTYTIADIKSFSLETWYRLFELYNRAIWPAQIAAIGAGLAMGSGLHLPHRGPGRHTGRSRVIAAILAACWLWVAIVFHAHRYATLTWSARYYAWGFGIEAALLLLIGVARGRLVLDRTGDAVARIGWWIFLFALFLARPCPFYLLDEVEAALDLTAAGRVRWELLVVPLLWCGISGATLLSMRAPDAWIPLAAAVVAVLLATSRTLGRRQGRARRRDNTG